MSQMSKYCQNLKKWHVIGIFHFNSHFSVNYPVYMAYLYIKLMCIIWILCSLLCCYAMYVANVCWLQLYKSQSKSFCGIKSGRKCQHEADYSTNPVEVRCRDCVDSNHIAKWNLTSDSMGPFNKTVWEAISPKHVKK